MEQFKYTINSEVSVTLSWSANPKVRDNSQTNATFKSTDIKLYVAVVTLSVENDNKLLEQLKTGFKRTIKWNKYRSESSNETKNNNLNYLIDPTFTNVNRLFFLSFKNNQNDDEENESVRTSFKKNIMYQKFK